MNEEFDRFLVEELEEVHRKIGKILNKAGQNMGQRRGGQGYGNRGGQGYGMRDENGRWQSEMNERGWFDPRFM